MKSRLTPYVLRLTALIACCLLPVALSAATLIIRGPVAGPANNGFSLVKTVTIDHTKVGSSAHTNFPLLFRTTHNDFRTVANGGSATSTSGHDIVFYPNSDCSGTKYSHTPGIYSATTGEVERYVKIPSVSNAVDTVFYACVGKSGLADQSDAAGAWDGNYLAAYSFGDGTTISNADSTSSAYTLTNTSVTAVAGSKTKGAASFNGTSSFYKNTSFAPPGSVTVAFWQNVNASLPSFPYTFILGSTWGATSPRILAHAPYSDSTLYWDFGDDGTGRVSTNYASYIGAWTYVVLTYNHGTGDHKIFLNGSQVATSTASKTNTALGTGISIGGCDNTVVVSCTGFAPYSRMDLDEFQVSNVARSADWILAQYNNQNSPATFYTVTP